MPPKKDPLTLEDAHERKRQLLLAASSQPVGEGARGVVPVAAARSLVTDVLKILKAEPTLLEVRDKRFSSYETAVQAHATAGLRISSETLTWRGHAARHVHGWPPSRTPSAATRRVSIPAMPGIADRPGGQGGGRGRRPAWSLPGHVPHVSSYLPAGSARHARRRAPAAAGGGVPRPARLPRHALSEGVGTHGEAALHGTPGLGCLQARGARTAR